MMSLKIQNSPSSATEFSQFSQNMSPITDPPKGSVTEQMWLHGWGIKDMVAHQLFLSPDVSSIGGGGGGSMVFIVCVETG